MLGIGLHAPQDVGGDQVAQRGVARVFAGSRAILANDLKRAALPSRPGLRKSKIDHRSPRRFSTGVPVRATRVVAVEFLDGLGLPRRRVLDRLGFVEDHPVSRCAIRSQSRRATML